MLQPTEIQQRFNQIQQTINQAEEVTRNGSTRRAPLARKDRATPKLFPGPISKTVLFFKPSGPNLPYS